MNFHKLSCWGENIPTIIQIIRELILWSWHRSWPVDPIPLKRIPGTTTYFTSKGIGVHKGMTYVAIISLQLSGFYGIGRVNGIYCLECCVVVQ